MSSFKFGTASKTDKHIHSLDSVKVVNVIADNSEYDLEKNGVWAFLIRYCNCGLEQAFDMLHRQDAEAKLEGILERG